MGLLDFFSQEAGQSRRRWLDENAQGLLDAGAYMIGPDAFSRVNGLLELADMVNPVSDVGRAMQSSERMLDPTRGPWERAGAGISMLTDVASVAAPAAAGAYADDAARGLVDSLSLLTMPADDAVAKFALADEGGAGLDFYRMPDQAGILREAQERTRASTPTSWLDPKFERGFHPASNTKLGDVNVAPVFDDRGSLGDIAPLSFEDLQGKVLTPAYGDRTRAGGDLLGYDDVRFDPVEMHGGQGFMRETGTGVWASESGPMRAKAKTVQAIRESGGDPRLIYTAMGAQSGDFSRMMADAVAGQLKDAQIPKQAAAEFDARMQSLLGGVWPGIGNIDAVHDLPGSTRWAVWQEMDRAKWRDLGFPDIGRTRLALTDPQLLDADPFDTGLSVSIPGQIWDNPNVLHPTYSTQIDGEYIGDTPLLPGPMIWRDFFNARRAAGASPASDQRAFMMNSPTITQVVDQQMVDEVAAYLAARQ